MEIGLILAFALGFIVSKIFTILFLTKRVEWFILNVHLEALIFIGMVAEIVSFNRAIKRAAMLEAGKSLKEVENVEEYDRRLEERTKQAVIQTYKAAFPRDFKFMVENLTWDSALEEITKQIKTKGDKDAFQ